MSSLAILGLRALLVLIALGALVGQIFFVPAIAIALSIDSGHPEVAILYSIAGIAAILCIEVALVAVWALLSMVRQGAIFSARAFRWVDVITVAAIVATALSIAICLHVGLVVEPPLDAPGMNLMSGGIVIVGAAFVLLMVVMRGLLRSATNLQSELAEVV